MKKVFTLGLMSGTSVDAIDASLVESNGRKDHLHLHMQFAFKKEMRESILALIRSPQADLAELTRLHYAIGDVFADAAEKTIQAALKKKFLKKRTDLLAIGSHGQTVFHDPLEKRTLQIGEASRIAALTGITTVSDFRVADTALGGEGAPLLPFYHQRLFASEAKSGIVVHNLGGISNFTYIGPKGKIFALDTGPANCLLDGAVQTLSLGKTQYDENGHLASMGKLSVELLGMLMDKPDIAAFRKRKAPKSTGRELFSPSLLQQAMKDYAHLLPEDLLHTLSHFTVDTIIESYQNEILKKKLPLKTVVVAGGGSRNGFLLSLLQKKMPKVEFLTMEDYGWSSQALESQAFGYFAYMALAKKPITFPTTTGAQKPAVCGKISPVP